MPTVFAYKITNNVVELKSTSDGILKSKKYDKLINEYEKKQDEIENFVYKGMYNKLSNDLVPFTFVNTFRVIEQHLTKKIKVFSRICVSDDNITLFEKILTERKIKELFIFVDERKYDVLLKHSCLETLGIYNITTESMWVRKLNNTYVTLENTTNKLINIYTTSTCREKRQTNLSFITNSVKKLHYNGYCNKISALSNSITHISFNNKMFMPFKLKYVLTNCLICKKTGIPLYRNNSDRLLKICSLERIYL
jgi:hypothetical protein